METGKTARYLKYAIGEILLVVIGILIALGVNQRSQRKDNEAKIEAIFEVIMQDLTADITECSQIIETVAAVDSITHSILNDSINKLSSTQNSDIAIFDRVNVLGFTNLFNFTDGGFKSLSQNLDILPKKYNDILTDLNQQYNAVKESVEYWDNRVNMLTAQNENYLVNNFPWFYNPSLWRGNVQELIEHPKYKNLLYKFKDINHAWLSHVSRYRTHSINNYQKIARLLGKPIIDESFKVEDDIANLFIGEWKNESNPERAPTLFTIEDGRLFIQFIGHENSKRELFIRSKVVNDSVKDVKSVFERFMRQHIFKGDSMIMRYNEQEDNSVRDIKFSKVNEG